MKSWGELVFDGGTDVLRTVVQTLCDLPEPLRATRHCLGEDEVAQPIGDVAKFLSSLSSDRMGPLLRAKGAQYIVSALGSKRIECTCQFQTRGMPFIRAFIERMAALKPLFGFASAWDEYRHRNQLDVALRLHRVQVFVGNNISKCVPGLYWLTLLPDSLAEEHGVPLPEVQRGALEHVALGDGQRLFRFHDHPGAWRERADDLDGLCAVLPGVFNISDLRTRIVGVTEQKQFDAIVDPWR